MTSESKTIFCDIDGTLVRHYGNLSKQYLSELELLEGTIDKLNDWDRKRYNIILVTGRRESMRNLTERQLEKLGIFYDQLIMGLGGGQRILINDLKPYSDEPTATVFNVVRNKGIKDVEI